MVEMNYDATVDEPDPGVGCMPKGWYRVAVVDTALKVTKNGKGKYLWIQYSVVGGDYNGLCIWDQLMREHSESAKTVKIADGQLWRLCRAVGLRQMTNSEQLHGKELGMRVSVQPAKDGYPESNRVEEYRSLDKMPGGGSKPAAAQPSADDEDYGDIPF